MKVHSVEYVASAARLAQLPRDGRPEIAVAGRSNVGKSSLINVLARRRGLARVSAVPGRTRLLTFFLVDQRFYLVDLPGYGYANVPDAIRRGWRALVEGYLRAGRDVRGVLLLMDARRGVTEQELRLKRFLDACAVRCLPVLTKIDKVARCEWKPRMRAVAEALLLADPGAVIPFSAATGEGREALLAAIQSCMGGSRATPVRR